MILKVRAARAQPKDMDAAEAYFDLAWKRFEEAEALIPEADRGKPMKPMQVPPPSSARERACSLP